MIACTCFSAELSCGPDFCLIFTPRISYDEPEILLKQFCRSVSWSLTGNTWRHDTLPFLSATIGQIKAAVPAEIIVLGRVPQLAGMPDVIFRNVPDPAAINKLAWERRYKIFDDMEARLSAIARDSGVSFVSKVEAVCPDRICEIVIGSEMGYTDPQHWSLAGMKVYGARLITDPVFKAALSR